MRTTAGTLAIFLITALSGPAGAQDFPAWPLNAVCTTTEVNCRLFEAQARGEASGVWATLPPKVRSQCVEETVSIQPSYRMLLDCLAIEMQRLAKEAQAQR